MALSFYLDQFDKIQELKPIAEKVRRSLPSKARQILKDALHNIEMKAQEFALKNRYVHNKFERMRFLVKGALEEL